MITYERLTADFVADVSGINLADGFDMAVIDDLAEALFKHKVLVLRNQHLTDAQYASFGRSWTGNTRIDSFTEMHVPGYDDLNMVGNVGALFKDNGYRNGAAFWHTDCAAEPDPDAITMVRCIHALKTGGETIFADMESAYNALAQSVKTRIDDLIAHHCYAGAKPILGGREKWEFSLTPVSDQTEQQFPAPVSRPLVRAHSVTGNKCLYAPAGSIFKLEGVDNDEAEKLVHDLKLHAINEKYCYPHRYQPGDLIIWDNTATLHYAKPNQAATGNHDRRLMHRICPLGLPKRYQSANDQPNH